MPEDPIADVTLIAGVDAVPSILDVVCRTTGMGFSAVARVTDDRWIACSVRDDIGLGVQPGGELPVSTTICRDVRARREPIVINDVAGSDVWRDHPVPARYGFQSYISMPIVRSDGSIFGTLCALDRRAQRIDTPEVVGMFRLFAELIAVHIDTLERVAATEARLLDERKSSELREQFIAVLGHDLRNPLAAVSAGAQQLRKTPLSDKASRLVGIIEGGVARMSGLIDDVMDFARGRLGDGLPVALSKDTQLAPALRHVIEEARTSFPDRVIDAAITLDQPVRCDQTRVAQLLSNLLSNALTYGSAAEPVRVRAEVVDSVFELSVCNAGKPIPATVIDGIFKPFARGASGPDQQGLGLGLFIASEIARAHGGTLTATSGPDETRFTFRMPVDRRGFPCGRSSDARPDSTPPEVPEGG
jgi:signal transduction histidine kinase